MKPLYIFDLDGTLADLKHRRHHVERPVCTACARQHEGTVCPAGSASSQWKANWSAFHAACVDDTPIAPVIDIMNRLRRTSDIWVFSGRSDAVRTQSVAWLRCHTELNQHDVDHQFRMRRAGDYTPDHVLKLSWYRTMSVEDRRRLVAVFDDRDRVVAMWRSQGVVCLQCAPGDF